MLFRSQVFMVFLGVTGRFPFDKMIPCARVNLKDLSLDLYEQILIRYWGFSKFRPLQEDIIRSVMAGNDTLGLMPTGAGKSLTFQVPSLARDGICLVITPLISLMKDQVEKLKSLGIKAVAVYSGMTRSELDITLDNCIYGDFKFLYVSPERLGTELFRVRVEKMNVNMITVDEAHCISQWGYDFRPSYLNISDLREIHPDVPVLALTATATSDIVDDIQEKLKFKKKNIFRSGFERKNLIYSVEEVEDKLNYLVRLMKNLKGAGIIYVRSRKKTREIEGILTKNGISATYYHAGLDHQLRSSRQTGWGKGKYRVMVATNAFGMGIDKPDVRFVIHFDIPDSIESYYQEAGRAGRDEKSARAILLYNHSDEVKMEKRIRTGFPELQEIKRTYEALGNYFRIPVGSGKNGVYNFSLGNFVSKFKFSLVIAYNSLKILEREGYIELTEEVQNPSRVHFIVNRDDLYRFQVSNLSFDGFIKLLLRSYTGLFTEYVNISEQFLAARAHISVERVIEFLKKLSSLKIISYIPRKNTPFIVYTEERLDMKNLALSHEHLKKRKEGFIKRQKTVWEYATSKAKCRSLFLLEYFGEKDTQRCGQCDVCQRRNKLDMSSWEFDKVIEQVKVILREKAMKLADIFAEVDTDEDQVMKVIRYLLDNDKIVYESHDRLRWKKHI